MNIVTVIDYLNRTYGYDLDSTYYSYIGDWTNWWKGRYKPFHVYHEKDYTGHKKEREMYSLRMAKKVCEDWASILMNEKVRFEFEDKASQEFICGAEDTYGGVLAENHFEIKGNELVEKAFASGTGAFVLRIQGMEAMGETVKRSSDSKIKIEYLTANHIVPLSVSYGEITEAAFVSDVLQGGEEYVYIETHRLEGGQYRITNAYFEDEEGQLKPAPLPEGMIESFTTGSDIPLFTIVKPNLVNNIMDTALGISIFANAIDNLKGVDLAFHNFNRDFKLGGKKVFVNDSLTKTDEYGNTITPDDVAQQLFVTVGDDIVRDEKTLIQEHNPTLRVQENIDGIQAQLDYLSFKCGLGAKYYQFNAGGTAVTATQYAGEKQDLMKNINKQYIALDGALKRLIRSILWIGREIVGAPVDPDTKVTVKFDDSFISDKDSERANDLQELRDGIMQKWEYRVKWYGEDEETAKAMTKSESNGGGWFDDEGDE